MKKIYESYFAARKANPHAYIIARTTGGYVALLTRNDWENFIKGGKNEQ